MSNTTDHKHIATLRSFSYAAPVQYRGAAYPSSMATMQDEGGSVTQSTIFADRDGNYYTMDDSGNAHPALLTATLPQVEVLPPKVRDANLQKQAMLRAAGYDVPSDGSMDLHQQALWQQLTTHPKQYDTTFEGLYQGLRDKLTGNNTYQSNPLNQGEITKYNPDNIDNTKTARHHSPLANAVGGTYVPGFATLYGAGKGLLLLKDPVANAKAVYNGISQLRYSPITSIGSIAGGVVGSIAGTKAVDTATKTLTGKDWSDFAQQQLGLGPLVAEWLNPGTYGIGYLVSKWGTNAERRAVETAMRTSFGAGNPLETLKASILAANNKRRRAVTDYILTGHKTGKKGYYNSFSPDIDNYYGGFNRTENLPKEDDIIDAFLYGKEVSPIFGLKKLNTSDYGMHNSYIKNTYPNKNIPVYEQQVSPSFTIAKTPESSIKFEPHIGTEGPGDFYNFLLHGQGVDVGGHLYRTGLTPDGQIVKQSQDIWKFKPKEYTQKWLNDEETHSSKYKEGLLKLGLREVDVLGTPIVTRTPLIKLNNPFSQY